jgi:hypothetical protein
MAGAGMDESFPAILVDVKRVAAWKSPASGLNRDRKKAAWKKPSEKPG